MAVVKNGDYWFFEWKIQGKKVRRSTGLKVQEATREYVRSLEESAKAELVESSNKEPNESSPSLLEAIERFYNEKWCRDRSGEKQRKNALVAADIIGKHKRLSEVSSKDLLRLKQVLFERGRAGSTVNRHISAIMVILNHACRYWEVLDRVPAVKREDESERVRLRVVSWDEEKKILAACDKIGDHDFRDLYVVLVDTGLRKNETLSLSYLSSIDLGNGIIKISSTQHKNKRAKEVPMSERVKEVLQERRKTHPQYPFKETFPVDSPLRRLHKVLKAAELPDEGDIVIHSLRHTFAARLANAHVPIYEVSKLLGHTSVKTTEQVYGHMFVDTLRSSIGVLNREVKNKGA